MNFTTQLIVCFGCSALLDAFRRKRTFKNASNRSRDFVLCLDRIKNTLFANKFEIYMKFTFTFTFLPFYVEEKNCLSFDEFEYK